MQANPGGGVSQGAAVRGASPDEVGACAVSSVDAGWACSRSSVGAGCAWVWSSVGAGRSWAAPSSALVRTQAATTATTSAACVPRRSGEDEDGVFTVRSDQAVDVREHGGAAFEEELPALFVVVVEGAFG